MTFATRSKFFYDQAGWSWRLDESPDEGRRRCANDLAVAEEWALDHGYTFIWADDWLLADHTAEYGDAYGNPNTCEVCGMLTEDGYLVGSLGCVDDATPQYRKVVEAELAYDRMREVES